MCKHFLVLIKKTRTQASERAAAASLILNSKRGNRLQCALCVCERVLLLSPSISLYVFLRLLIYIYITRLCEPERNVYSFIFVPLLRLVGTFSDEFHSGGDENSALRCPFCAEPRFNQPKRMFIITLKIPLVSFSIAAALENCIIPWCRERVW